VKILQTVLGGLLFLTHTVDVQLVSEHAPVLLRTAALINCCL